MDVIEMLELGWAEALGDLGLMPRPLRLT
jgi:hypothetical protein